MIKLSGFSKEPTIENIDTYPTILDVMECISRSEELNNSFDQPLLMNVRREFHNLNKLGYSYIIRDDAIGMNLLMPSGRSMRYVFRGQAKYYEPCLPILWRERNLQKRIQNTWKSYFYTAEMIIAMNSHPIINQYINNPIIYSDGYKKTKIDIPIQYDGLAQHYGIPTKYLDITIDKWVAAFFATTITINDTYQPFLVDENTEFTQRYGVFYLIELPHINDSIVRQYGIIPIGQQYFNRPGAQSALILNLNVIKDINHCPFVTKIFFRHDNVANKIIFSLSLNGAKYFPTDSLDNLVKKIINDSNNNISIQAVELARKIYFKCFSIQMLKEIAHDIGLNVLQSNGMTFEKEDVDNDVKKWQDGDDKRYLDRIMNFGNIIKPIFN